MTDQSAAFQARKRGRQLGHSKRARALILADWCQAVVNVKPETDRCCDEPLTGDAPQPWWHRVWDLPEIQPLATGCQVLFIADTGGYTAGGVIQDGGKYTLVYGGGSGLPVGEYSVQIAPPIVNTENAAPVDPSQMAGQLKLNRKSGKEASESGPFPSRYGSTSTSGLKFTVAPNQNTADFKLEKSDAKK
ncbi:hypothetical protein [Planctellipticum variicoloris]|uniref:hypothetical protein n=1 Tax=Planctellipticum variicoloris TaxID=3064265 RepID=UPI0030132004|nr:hypothetical protein SH412_003883 [Planctomycetaceae bacterium SH412]